MWWLVNLRQAQEAVAERDEGICQECGRPAVDIAHILPRRWKSQRAEIKNLIALCRKCHEKPEGYETRCRRLYQQWLRHGYDYEQWPYSRYWEN